MFNAWKELAKLAIEDGRDYKIQIYLKSGSDVGYTTTYGGDSQEALEAFMDDVRTKGYIVVRMNDTGVATCIMFDSIELVTMTPKEED